MAGCPYGARSMNYRDPRAVYIQDQSGFPDTHPKASWKSAISVKNVWPRECSPPVSWPGKAKALVFGDVEDPGADVRKLIEQRFNLRRKSHLGTGPQAYYIL